jgi:signal peptidase II
LAAIVLLLAAAFTAADQCLKLLAVRFLKDGGGRTFAGGYLRLVYTENRGAAFSILQNKRWFFVTVTFVICVLIIIALFKYEGHGFFSYAATALILGGGIGNMIDRVLNGYVVDYIYVTFFPAVFNFSDCCVTVGTVFLIIHMLFFSERDTGGEKVLRTRR